ncbi:hypothetical protein CRG98_000518 [Punica granatum]|uniref:G-patch domain-containing protein n=1 Tax=Punica granatum TaxID=22663 RepID=A0A2I0LEJ3_PUNGR|nr:hypothetical protein CRG98_000518 [Punica granatum]
MPASSKKVTEKEAEAFMKVIKASEYKVVEQMAKSSAHISLLALLLNSEPHREALMCILTAAQVPKGTPPDRIEETINSIFSNTISFSDDELLSEGCAHFRTLHIVCKCNNHIVGRVMIENGSALNVCPVTTLKQMNVDLNRIRPSKTAAGPSRADRMIGKVLLRNHYIPGTGLGARGQGINHPIEVEAYKHRRGLGFRLSCHEIIEAHRGNHLHRLATHYGRLHRGVPVPPLSHFFPGPPLIIGSTSDGPSSDFDDATDTLPTVYAVTEEIPSGVHIRPTQEDEELNNWTSVLRYSAVIADVLDPSIVKHFLPLDTEKFPPKRQQLRRQRASLLLRIKEEVVKQINAGFLEVCNYSEWVANIVPVEKKDGRVRVCVNYRDLNKASPKDNFPLPHIDILVDNTARHAQFSFMDGFSGYNQIRMADEDKIKTTFTTMWGTFYYRVMPFGLKNAGATYQRAMVTLFHDMMHKEVEVYVDDMIAKSKEGEDHLVNLKRLFDRLKEYKLRLNPARCTFGARSGKLLGFVVSERGIEVDPDKVKAIKELPPPSSVCETKDAKLVPYHEYLEKLTENFEDISFTYTLRMTNQFADALATLASMVSITRENLIEPLEIEIAEGPAHCNAIEASEAKPWSKTSLRRPRQKLGNEWRDLKSRKGGSRQKESTNHSLARSKTSLRRPRQKLGNEWRDLKSRKGGSRQKESTNHSLARSKTSLRRPRQKLEDPRGSFISMHRWLPYDRSGHLRTSSLSIQHEGASYHRERRQKWSPRPKGLPLMIFGYIL